MRASRKISGDVDFKITKKGKKESRRTISTSLWMPVMAFKTRTGFLLAGVDPTDFPSAKTRAKFDI